MLLSALSDINAAVAVAGALATLLIGANGVLFFRQHKLKKQAEANAANISAEAMQSEEWRKLYIDSRREIKELNAKIDELYAQISKQRDMKAELRERIAELEVTSVKERMMHCEVKRCAGRTPPTGF